MDALTLLQHQRAQNRADFAQSQADRAEAAATKPKQWTAQGRDADSGRMALAADSDEAVLVGSRITSGDIKPGQAVRVNVAGGTVTVDQKPHKRQQREADAVEGEAVPHWVAFGDGFAVSYDQDASTFIESSYPEYSEFATTEQGDRLFPYGSVRRFIAVSDTYWLVSGSIGVANSVHNAPPTMRLPFAVSQDQGKTWQLSEQFAPYQGGVGNLVSNLVWSSGYFIAAMGFYQLYRSEDGLVWEPLSATPLAGTGIEPGLLAVWNNAVYLLQSEGRLAAGSDSVSVLGKTLVHVYDDTQNRFVFAKQFDFADDAQYGAYTPYLGTLHVGDFNLLSLRESLYPFLLSSGDLDNVPDYGSAVYEYDPKTSLSLLHAGTNQVYPIVYGADVDGQVFLMLSQRWGYVNGITPFGFAAIHEGASWRTCEHPFLGKVDSNDSDVQSVAYNATLQRWLIFTIQNDAAIGGVNGDAWDEPFRPQLETTIARQPDYPLTGIADQIQAYQVGGNYVS